MLGQIYRNQVQNAFLRTDKIEKMIKDCYAQSEPRTKRKQGGSGLRSKGRSCKALLRVFVVSIHGHLA
jgi:hypothetical protein